MTKPWRKEQGEPGQLLCSLCEAPVTKKSLYPLPRWEQLESLKKEKDWELAHGMEVHSFLQELGPLQVQLQGLMLQVEAGSPEDNCHALQRAQQELPGLERRVHHLQNMATRSGSHAAWYWCPRKQ